MTFISSQRVWIDEQFIPATLKLEDGKITEIHNGILENSQFYENARIIPGLIDVHTHGYAGGDASDGDPETCLLYTSFSLSSLAYNLTNLFCQIFGCLDHLIPVSYTHLDVYKRQPSITVG